MNIDEAEQVKTELTDGSCRYSATELMDMLIEAIRERDTALANNVELAATLLLLKRDKAELALCFESVTRDLMFEAAT